MNIKENEEFYLPVDHILYKSARDKVKFYILNTGSDRVKTLNGFLSGSKISYKITWKGSPYYKSPYLFGKDLNKVDYGMQSQCRGVVRSVEELQEVCEFIKEKVKERKQAKDNDLGKHLDF